VIWGLQPVVLRRSAIDGLTAADVTVLRFLVSTLLLLPVTLRLRPVLVGTLGWRRAVALTSLSGSPFSLMLIGGIAFAPGFHNAVITNGMIPIAAIILAFAVLGQRPGWGKLAGIVLVAAGIGMFIGQSAGTTPGREGAWRGDLLFLIASIMWAMFGLLAGRWRVDPLKATATISLLSLATTPLLVLLLPMHLAQVDIAAIALQALYQGILVSILANFFYMQTVMLLGAVRATLFLPLIPVITTASGALLLGEQPSVWELAGIVSVIIGMAIALTSRNTASAKG
jgi:drug/metabolite transporter (DMT)-like permease